MQPVTITLEQPISQYVDYKNRHQHVPPQDTVQELIALGFEAYLHTQYQRYRTGEISFGWLAQELGITTWELSHTLEARSWTVSNLPA